MNKLSLISLSVFLSLLTSCSTKEEVKSEWNDGDVTQVSIHVEEMECEWLQSRLNVTTNLEYLWEENDTIGIFPSVGGQVEFPITEGIGTTTAQFNGGGWALKAGYTYSAYYPFNFYNRNSRKIDFSYVGQVQNGNDTRSHLSDYTFLAAAPTTVKDGAIDFSLNNVGAILYLHLTLPVATTYTTAKVYTDADVIPVRKSIDLQDELLTQTTTVLSNHLSIDLENITTTTANEVVRLWIAFPSMSASDHTLKVVVYDAAGLPYTADITKSDNTTLVVASFEKNQGLLRYASPTLNSGFNIGIHDWGDGEEIEGTLQ